MNTLKGILKIAIAMVAIGVGAELGKKGLNDVKNGSTKK